MNTISKAFADFVRALYQTDDFIPLHAPLFIGKEKQYVCDAIDSTFVSSVSDYVTRFEAEITGLTGARYAVATVNGTAGLHLALHATGTGPNDEVITQAFSFIATANAIRYTGAVPSYVDIDASTLGMCATALEEYLDQTAERRDDGAYNRYTGRRISACVPMHTFGHPLHIHRIARLCSDWGITLIEDAAEAIGSTTEGVHCGTIGRCGVLSFNGNKIITTGGGGAIVTNEETLAKQVRHLATTAKVPHQWEYNHDVLGFNYRLPGLNAALGCAQFESLPQYLADKRKIAQAYQAFAQEVGVDFVSEPENCHANYWLNALAFDSLEERDAFLEHTNAAGIMTRPPWGLICDQQGEESTHRAYLPVSRQMVDTLVNVPSGMRG